MSEESCECYGPDSQFTSLYGYGDKAWCMICRKRFYHDEVIARCIEPKKTAME